MRRFRIGDGDAGITATIKVMQNVTFGREGVQSPYVRAAALSAVRGMQRGLDEIHAIFEWVKENIEFRGEHAETIQTPLITLQLGAGDCDDHSTLLAAMYESIGFETRFNTMSTREDPDDQFSHVFLEVRTRGGVWLPVDTTVGSSYPGWHPPNARRQKIRSSRPASSRPGWVHDLVWLGLGIAASSFLLNRK